MKQRKTPESKKNFSEAIQAALIERINQTEKMLAGGVADHIWLDDVIELRRELQRAGEQIRQVYEFITKIAEEKGNQLSMAAVLKMKNRSANSIDL